MRFVGKVWRLLVGVKDGLVLVFMLLFFATLFAALSASPQAGSTSEGALLLDLKGTIVEQPAEASATEVLTGSTPVTREYRRRDVVHALRAAATDDRVKAVALDLDTFLGGGQATLNDVAAAIGSVRRAGKPVLAYATGYSDDAYLLASQASEVWLNPMGAVLITGPGGINLYYKGLLDKLGVTANVYRVGAYKAAVEPFTRTDMSPEARAAGQALAGALWENWQQDVRRARPKAQLAPYVSAPVEQFAAAGGHGAGRAFRRLGRQAGGPHRVRRSPGRAGGPAGREASGKLQDDQVRFLDRRQSGGRCRWRDRNPHRRRRDRRRQGRPGHRRSGNDRRQSPEGPRSEESEGARAAGRFPRRIDARFGADPPGRDRGEGARTSGGGLDGLARGKRRLLDLDAGGSYPRGARDDHGIDRRVRHHPELPGHAAEDRRRGGRHPDDAAFRRAERLSRPSPGGRPAHPAQRREYLQEVPGARFGGAEDAPEQVHRIAQGRVWDGGTARQLGLVDGFGSLDDAVREAARRAKLDPDTAKPVYLEKKPGFWDQMLASWRDEDGTEVAGRDIFSRVAARPEAMLMRGLYDAQRILSGPAIQARCLECPTTALPLRKNEQASLSAWLAGLLAR